MSLKSGWVISAMVLAGLAGYSGAEGPTWGVVTYEQPPSGPAAEPAWRGAEAPCDQSRGRFGSWFVGMRGDGCGERPLHLKAGCGKASCACLGEAYGYNNTCWRPWTAPSRCPRCAGPLAGPPVAPPAMPVAAPAPPAPDAVGPNVKTPAPKKAPDASPYH